MRRYGSPEAIGRNVEENFAQTEGFVGDALPEQHLETIRYYSRNFLADETALLADGAPAFIDAVTRLLACTESRRKLGNAGRLLLEKEFTWETAWEKLDL